MNIESRKSYVSMFIVFNTPTEKVHTKYWYLVILRETITSNTFLHTKKAKTVHNEISTSIVYEKKA